MPLLYQQDINENAKIGVWKITEDESFFLKSVMPLYTIRHPKKRIQHLAARLLLLTLDHSFPIDDIKVSESGKPFLEKGYHFSITHSGNYAAVILSQKQNTGIDFEVISDKILHLKDKFTDMSEIHLLWQIDGNASIVITLIWSIKEAIYKWHGDGGLDFKNQIRILSVSENDNQFILDCELHLEQVIRLQVVALLMEGNCLAYVLA